MNDGIIKYAPGTPGVSGADEAELEAFRADLEMARYTDRVEKGELTEEELENRNAMLSFIFGSGLPDGFPDGLFEEKK